MMTINKLIKELSKLPAKTRRMKLEIIGVDGSSVDSLQNSIQINIDDIGIASDESSEPDLHVDRNDLRWRGGWLPKDPDHAAEIIAAYKNGVG